MKFLEKLRNRSAEVDNYLCVGIDPDPDKFPNQFEKSPQGVLTFCKSLIDITSKKAAAYKFNLAFFELWGAKGFEVLSDLMNYVPEGIFTIGDAKKGDIGNSSKFYARAMYENFHFDSVTINPYLGSESIKPFIKDRTKGVFVLCVTSNPSGRELQDHGEPKLYQKTAQVCQQLDQKSKNVGLVMGATKPEQLIEIRRNFPEMPFLIPGIGSQGGTIEAAVQVCNKIEAGLINVSRGISFPEGRYPENIKNAVDKYADLFSK